MLKNCPPWQVFGKISGWCGSALVFFVGLIVFSVFSVLMCWCFSVLVCQWIDVLCVYVCLCWCVDVLCVGVPFLCACVFCELLL